MGGAHIFSIACLACKLCRRPIVQAAVWSLFVVIMAPDGDLPSGVKQVLKPTDSRALFAQPPVKAFDMRVLRGLTGLDMHQLDLLLKMHHARKCRLVSSGPLSQRIDLGPARCWMISSSTRVTRRLAKLVSTSSARHSHVHDLLRCMPLSSCHSGLLP